MADAGTQSYLALDPQGNVTLPAQPPLENWHLVGAPGEPAFQNGWANLNPAYYPVASFRVDRDGRVWLRGAVTGGVGSGDFGSPRGANAIWTLPAGYAPRKTRYPIAMLGGGAVAFLRITGTDEGAVNGNPGAIDAILVNGPFVDLGELSFDPNN